ncbi:GST-like protein [Oxalobacteraceae bacterium GrIS 2.11]
MLDLYAYATPNSVKISVALEELGLEYNLHEINIRKGEQKLPEFLSRNPNGKVPVLVDPDTADSPLILTESAAILVYLAEKTGKLLPVGGVARARVFEQLFFHASGLGPAFGNAGYFQKLAPEPDPHAIDRFKNEGKRLLVLLDQILADNQFVAGQFLTIADIAHFGWFWRREFAGFDFADTPNIERWYKLLEARPAFQRGIARTSALAQG